VIPDGPPSPSVFKTRIGVLGEGIKAKAPPFYNLGRECEATQAAHPSGRKNHAMPTRCNQTDRVETRVDGRWRSGWRPSRHFPPLLASFELPGTFLKQPSWLDPARFRLFSRRHGRYQLFHAKNVERPAQIVGERRQAELGAHFLEAAHEECPLVHPYVDGPLLASCWAVL
jgi:hypothetical protein